MFADLIFKSTQEHKRQMLWYIFDALIYFNTTKKFNHQLICIVYTVKHICKYTVHILGLSHKKFLKYE